jgi:hypothetical protein
LKEKAVFTSQKHEAWVETLTSGDPPVFPESDERIFGDLSELNALAAPHLIRIFALHHWFQHADVRQRKARAIGKRPMSDNHGPQTSLDLTHVLCTNDFKPPPKTNAKNQPPDDDSSLFSLALALVTLTPILLMVKKTQQSHHVHLLNSNESFRQPMQRWQYKRGNISSSSCGQVSSHVRDSIGRWSIS